MNLEILKKNMRTDQSNLKTIEDCHHHSFKMK